MSLPHSRHAPQARQPSAGAKLKISERPWWPWLKRVAITVFFGVVLSLLVTQARDVDWAEVLTALRGYSALSVGLAVVLGAGSLALLYFGWDVLLVVAVELAFSFASARTAVKVAREGWLQAAVRLTWKPLLGALACAVLLGALLDTFLPEANSLLQAIRLVR